MMHFETFYKRPKKKKPAVSSRSAVTAVGPALKRVAERGSGAFLLTLNTGVPIREVLSWISFGSVNK